VILGLPDSEIRGCRSSFANSTEVTIRPLTNQIGSWLVFLMQAWINVDSEVLEEKESNNDPLQRRHTSLIVHSVLSHAFLS
jgi:hypothetical protein